VTVEKLLLRRKRDRALVRCEEMDLGPLDGDPLLGVNRELDQQPLAAMVAPRVFICRDGFDVGTPELDDGVTQLLDPQRQDSCRSLARLISGARRQRFGDEAILPGL
jgi:hypothetical protein